MGGGTSKTVAEDDAYAFRYFVFIPARVFDEWFKGLTYIALIDKLTVEFETHGKRYLYITQSMRRAAHYFVSPLVYFSEPTIVSSMMTEETMLRIRVPYVHSVLAELARMLLEGNNKLRLIAAEQRRQISLILLGLKWQILKTISRAKQYTRPGYESGGLKSHEIDELILPIEELYSPPKSAGGVSRSFSNPIRSHPDSLTVPIMASTLKASLGPMFGVLTDL